MPRQIQCPKCAKRYQVADAVAGKQVRCQQCQTAFVASAAPRRRGWLPRRSRRPIPSRPECTLWAIPWEHRSAGHLAGGSARELSIRLRRGHRSAAYQIPPAGPTDVVMRTGQRRNAGGRTHHDGRQPRDDSPRNGTVYLAVIGLAPLALILGTAGLISPNVVRACGKYGGHLSWHYKAIGYGLMGLYLVVLILLMVGLFMAGFQPDRPGMR